MSSLPSNLPTGQTAYPVPPRYWWLKRILLVAGALIVALVLLRLWWGYEAERRLQAAIAEYRAAGQPVTIEDFQFPAVPDEENAAHFLLQAASAIAADPNSALSISNVMDNAKLMESRPAAVRRLIADNVAPLRQLRLARSKQQVDWGIRFTRPIFNITGTVLPSLSPERELGRLLWVTTAWQHRNGDDAAAIETSRDAIAHGERVGQMGVVVAYLTGLALDALACDAIQSIAPDLLVVDAPSTSPTAPSPARREQVQALIGDLLDETGLQGAWRRSRYADRLWHLEMARDPVAATGLLTPAVSGTGLLQRVCSFPLAPMLKLDCLFSAQLKTALLEAGLAEDYPTAEAHVLRYPGFDSGIERGAHSLSLIGVPSLDHAILLHFRRVAQRRMAAVALAIRMYELDHGQRPRALDELVPEYVPAVPRDPFAPDGRTLGYLPNAPKPILCCFGPDTEDDGGEYEGDGWLNWMSNDLPFFLDGERPDAPCQPLATQPAATQAVEDQGDEVSDEGQADEDQEAADTP